jgi:hypothetical protein
MEDLNLLGKEITAMDNPLENRKLMYQAFKEATVQGDCVDFPKTGEGVNQRVMAVTSRIAKMRLWIGEDEKAHEVIREEADACGREISDAEIQSLLDGARDYFSKYPNSKKKAPQKFPKLDHKRLAKLENIEEGSLFDSSPVRGLSIFKPHWFLEQLFPDDSYVCVGKKWKGGGYPCTTRKLADHNKAWLNRQELVVPARMTAEKGIRKGAKDPENPTAKDLQDRGLNNTGDRLYLVIESDVLDKAEQEKVLYHYSKKLPLAMIVDSAGKSLHGWFNVFDKEEDEVMKFLKGACRLGADERMKVRCQLCRLPNGLRKGEQQTVLYFNPENAVGGDKQNG